MATQKEDILYIKSEQKKQGVLLERLANAVCGDTDFGQTGLIQQVNGHSEYIEHNNCLGIDNSRSIKILEINN